MAIIFTRDPLRFLIVLNPKSRQYSFVAGGSNKGETYADTAIREIKEEVSLDISKDELIETDFFNEFTRQDWKTGVEVLNEQKVFLVEIKDQHKAVPKDVLKIIWLSENELEGKLTRGNLLDVFKKVKGMI